MENKDTSAVRHAMKFGAIVGLGLTIFSLLLYAFGINQNEFQYPSYLIMVVGLIAGIKRFRDLAMDGFISYGKALKTGTLIALFGAFIFNFYMYIFYKYIDASQLDLILEQVKIQMVNQGRSEEEMDLAMTMMEKFMTPGGMFISGIFGYTLTGFIFSLIIAIFLKKENLSPEIENK